MANDQQHLVNIEKVEYHYHNHIDTSEILSLLNILKLQNSKIMADLTTLEQEVAENKTVTESAVTLLKGLKAALDAAGTDPAKLKALSDSLSTQTDDLAAAVSENTPAAP